MVKQVSLLGLGLLGAGPLLSACGDNPNTASGQPLAAPTGTSGNPGPSATAGTLTNLRMASWSQPISEQTNIYAAQENGWFKEQELDFTFIPGAGGGDALKNILAGNADIAFTNVEPLLFAIQEGAKIKAIYNIYPQNVFNIVTPKSSGIKSIADLKGKKVGVYSQSSGTRYNLLVMLKSVGLKESDLEIVAAGVANFGPLKEGKVDATASTDTGLFAYQETSPGDLTVLWARDTLNTPSDIFVVTEEVYLKKKDLLGRFLKAYKKGTQWMLDNADQAAALAVKYANDGKDVKRNKNIIELRNQSTLSEKTKTNGLGFFDLDLLKKVETTFFELGITKQHFDIPTIFTNEFISP